MQSARVTQNRVDAQFTVQAQPDCRGYRHLAEWSHLPTPKRLDEQEIQLVIMDLSYRLRSSLGRFYEQPGINCQPNRSMLSSKKFGKM